MRRILVKFAAAAFGLSLAAVLVPTLAASAHEHRLVAGKYNFVVGWGDEPTYSGFKNSVQLILSDAAEQPITDLGDTLQVEVTTGDQTVTLPIEASFVVGVFGEPGDYRANIVPTRSGTYSFHFTGTIHGDSIDETFTSSETTFASVADVSDIAFPVKDPSAGDLAERIDRETSRVDGQFETLDAQVSDNKDSTGTATTLAVVSLVVGALGLITGGVGLLRRR